MSQAFTKMQAAGNDFMVVVGRALPVPDRQRIRALADRRRGVGFDQLLWVDEPQGDAEAVRYRVFNADGGEAGQCGNGALCIAALIASRGPDRGEIVLRCPGGEVRAKVNGEQSVSCSLGRPEWRPRHIPFVAGEEQPCYTLDVNGQSRQVEALSLGNPHAVVAVADADAAPMEELGAGLSAHERFPEGCNVGFSQTLGNHALKLRVYERGVGETPACGTGACAAAIAGIRRGRVSSPVEVEMAGGRLGVKWRGGEEPVWLTGNIDWVFEGRTRL